MRGQKPEAHELDTAHEARMSAVIWQEKMSVTFLWELAWLEGQCVGEWQQNIVEGGKTAGLQPAGSEGAGHL